MDSEVVFSIQKKGIYLHRTVYVIFLLQRWLLQILQKEVSLRNTILVTVVIGVFFLVEEVSYHKNYFNRILFIRTFRYLQCLIASMMIAGQQLLDHSQITMIGFVILFMIDFLLTMESADKDKVISYTAMVSVPILLFVIVKMAMTLDNQWIFLFFDIVIVIVILFFEAYMLAAYLWKKDSKIYSQRRELDEIAEKTENILNIQEKQKQTNYLLNVQKVDLQNANRLIQTANEEMHAQVDILHYISMSFDLPKISNQITDAIMQVKQLGFCGLYIRENAYLNKHANYVIKTTMGQFEGKLKDSISDIYQEMVDKQLMELSLHGAEKNQMHILQDVNINSVYIKVLGSDDETYGLFIIGDSRTDLFKGDMSFYDAIIAQFDIVIHNAKIYGEMQHMAQKDGLTGINNRIYFNQLFQKQVNNMIKEQGCMSVALFDIDKFKSVNDTYGHLAGDEVIKCIAGVAEECIEKYGGFVCRYGGEEFVAALPNKKLEIAQPIIEELFEEICSQKVVYNEYEIPISVSIGLTSYPEICNNTDELLKRADWCMYYAKEHGRHQINVDDGSVERL